MVTANEVEMKMDAAFKVLAELRQSGLVDDYALKAAAGEVDRMSKSVFDVADAAKHATQGFNSIPQAIAADERIGGGVNPNAPTHKQLSHMRSALEAVAKLLNNLEDQSENQRKYIASLQTGTMVYVGGGQDFGRVTGNFQMPADIVRPFANIELRVSLGLLTAVYQSLAGVPILEFKENRDPSEVISDYLGATATKLKEGMEDE